MKAWHDIVDILASIDEECLHHAIAIATAMALAKEHSQASDAPLALRLWAVLKDIKTMQRIAGVKEGTDA